MTAINESYLNVFIDVQAIFRIHYVCPKVYVKLPYIKSKMCCRIALR